MRKDGQFNFEQLSRGANKVTIADCQNLFEYSKVKFERQRYDGKLIDFLSMIRSNSILLL